jgi:hypothetical protein
VWTPTFFAHEKVGVHVFKKVGVHVFITGAARYFSVFCGASYELFRLDKLVSTHL